MPENIEQAFLNTVLAFKLMSYSYSLKSFFKNEFKRNDGFIIPYFICKETYIPND